MTLKVIGAGLGRTGTQSLKLALARLGLGPCHHMEDVFAHLAEQVPLWTSAVNGAPDWATIYSGYNSANDWPTASFYRELHAAYPGAKFVLTVRSAQSWAESFSQTIYKLMAGRDRAPPHMADWFAMVSPVLGKVGFVDGLDVLALERTFDAHNAAVKAAIPAKMLLTFEVKDGWDPLCSFLGLPVPSDSFPRSNSRADFWERVSPKK